MDSNDAHANGMVRRRRCVETMGREAKEETTMTLGIIGTAMCPSSGFHCASVRGRQRRGWDDDEFKLGLSLYISTAVDVDRESAR
jgi:hypothetical protein